MDNMLLPSKFLPPLVVDKEKDRFLTNSSFFKNPTSFTNNIFVPTKHFLTLSSPMIQLCSTLGTRLQQIPSVEYN